VPQTLAEQDPVLTPPPDPASFPQRPDEGDRHLALIWIMGGRTSADAAAMAESISGWVTRRTALEIRSEDERLVRYLEVMLDELAAERTERAVRLAADMAALEAGGWTPESARAALSLPEPRKPAAA
jgi:hypothetical protein